MHNKFKNNNKNEDFAFKCFSDQLVSVLFPVNVFQPKFAAARLRQICETLNLRVFLNSALFLLLVGSGPKRSMPIEKLGSSSLVSSIFQREGKVHCSLKDDNFAAR